MTQLYAQPSQQGIWMALGPPTSAAFALGQSLVVTYGDGTQDALAAHVPAVTSAGTTQVDRTGAVWLLYVVHGDPTLRIVREMDQATIAGSYAPLARVLADRVVPYQPDNGQAQSSTSGQSFLPLTVTNQSSTQSIGGSGTVPVGAGSTDYVVQCHLTGSTAASVWNALSDKTSFSDLQVLFAGAELDADIDQATNGAWSAATITLWFRLQRPIAAAGTDQGYQLRMGGGLRSSPPRNWANIYPLADDFVSWNSAYWGTQPSWATLASSILSMAGPGPGAGQRQLEALAPYAAYGTAYAVCSRCILALASDVSSAQYVGLVADAQDYALADVSRTLSVTNWVINQTNAAGFPGGTLGMDAIDGGAYHVYSVGRDASGHAVAWRDGTAPATFSSYPFTLGAGPIIALTNQSSSMLVDWIKVRPFLLTEPTVEAGTLQSAGGLRWEPITDTSGSVLVDSSAAPVMALVTIT